MQKRPARRGPVTATRLLEELHAKPEWLAMREAKDRALAERAAELRKEQKPLLDDLAAIGVVVDSAWQLRERPNYDERVYPILLTHLMRTYSTQIKEGIARAFGVKAARAFVWDRLLNMVRSRAVDPAATTGLMASISVMARPGDLDELVELIRDRSLGSDRVFLVSNLMRSKRPEARATLLDLQDDPNLAKEIMARLKLRKV